MVNIPHQHHIEVNSLPDEIMASVERHPAVPAVQHHGAITFRDHRARIKEALVEQERTEILELISQHKGNLSQTARSMGISRTSLYRKLAKSGNP
jgi:transcriptional regulator with PAS, ATPase and Fis domain